MSATRRHATIVVGLLALVGVLTGGFYFSRNPERETLDDAVRAHASGKFVRLADGVTHYDLAGPDSARTVVLIHGFSVPAYIWDSTATALVAAGYRVLRYDEYGRGYSDRPDVGYSADLYDRQLVQLLDSLRVRSLILSDPVAGVSARVAGKFYWPLIGSYLWQTTAVPGMAEGQTSDFVDTSRFPDWTDRYRPQMRFRGFGRALLSTRRETGGMNTDTLYGRVEKSGVPVLLLWGVADKTVPFDRNSLVRQAIPDAEFHAIDGAAHLPIVERASVADSLILDFLSRQRP